MRFEVWGLRMGIGEWGLGIGEWMMDEAPLWRRFFIGNWVECFPRNCYL